MVNTLTSNRFPIRQYLQIGCGLMGFTPTEIRKFSVREFLEAFEGWKHLHGMNYADPLTRRDFQELMSKYPD